MYIGMQKENQARILQHVPKRFEIKEWKRNGKSSMRTLITPKGQETFRLLL